MYNSSKPKSGRFAATIFALSSVSITLAATEQAIAVPLYQNDFSNGQLVRLQMEQLAPNGSPVTLNITPSYGLKNGGIINTWIGVDNDSLFKYATNGFGIRFDSNYGGYSINVPTLDITPGTVLNTYASGFSRYQDWNIEKLGGKYGDTYLFHWRTDTNTNLCIDIRGFGQGQQLNNQTPVLWNCDPNNINQRIRVIKQGQAPPNNPTPVRPTNSLFNNTTMPPGSSIKSDNQYFSLNAQTDGNLVLYRQSNGQALWNTGTYGRSVKQTIFQSDGNLVIYDTNNSPVWDSRTYGRGGTRLTLQDDGNFVMYNAQNQAI
jgi:hypothetical protein